MGIDVKKLKDKKTNKLITVILVGILILVVLMPVSKQEKNMSLGNSSSGESLYGDSKGEDSNYDNGEKYYEERLKNMLEESYGKGNINVMVYMKSLSKDSFSYTNEAREYEVDGVLVVAKINSEKAISDITFAISALFNIPTHKVAVITSNQ